MITGVAVTDYQSLGKATFRLGRFTVVTGPTGSGKSALIRALKLLAFNARGSSYIRRGAKTCKVAAGDSDALWAVSIERDVSRRKDAYRVVTPGKDVQDYTKLAGGVPEAVTNLLALSPLNFASQFDRPYLLDASGGEVARVLGELTNVTLVFNAAREANRRKLEVGAGLRQAEARVADLTAAAQSFRGLAARRAAAAEAEVRLGALQTQAQLIGQLERLYSQYLAYSTAADAIWPAPPEPPSLDTADAMATRAVRLKTLFAEHLDSAERETETAARVHAAAGLVVKAGSDFREAIVRAGRCPTCGQPVSEKTLVTHSQETHGQA